MNMEYHEIVMAVSLLDMSTKVVGLPSFTWIPSETGALTSLSDTDILTDDTILLDE